MDEIVSVFARSAEQWRSLGRKKPYWSVLTDDRFVPDALNDRHLQEFYATGTDEVELAEKFIFEAGEKLPSGKALDFGCGVGRTTFALGRRFDSVIGADISDAHLAEARANQERFGTDNCTFRLVQECADLGLKNDAPFDLVFTVLVLQHLEPVAQRFVLQALPRLTAKKGLLCFQIPTYHPEYTGDPCRHYGTEMDIHGLPQREVFLVMQQSKCEPLAVFDRDRVGGGWRSNYFIFRKR